MHNDTVTIIAEAGVNHNGDLELAKELVRIAAEAGADVIKFQTFDAAELVSETAPKADYQIRQTDQAESQKDMIARLQLSASDHQQLIEACEQHNIAFNSSAFDINSVDALVALGVEFLKVPSGEITNLLYLRHIGSRGKKVILSTGMASLDEVRLALETLEHAGTPRSDITVLHCNTEYPTPMQDVNLRAMQTIAQQLQVAIGYSDHTSGIEVAIAAVALGARVIEKHFTLDRTMPGPDHAASLEPDELHDMVAAIRNIEQALGCREKKPSPSELKNIPIARRSLVAAKPIQQGELYTADNLTSKRPGTGISPMSLEQVLGQPAPRAFAVDELVEL